MRIPVRLAAALAAFLPALALAQASPFETGANTLQVDLLAIFTPIAVIAVMGLGIAAAFGAIAWRWVIGSVAGIVLVFGATQMVGWVRGAFGV
jgi:type IV secretory pathway VirB2 component (pilin)